MKTIIMDNTALLIKRWDEIIKKHILCSCGEVYTSRGMAAPDCPYHAQDWETPMVEFLKELAAQSSPIEESKSDNSFFVHNNSDAFREFLDLSKVKWEPAEHSTKIVQGDILVNQFFLGGAWREYDLKNNPKYIEDKTQAN